MHNHYPRFEWHAKPNLDLTAIRAGPPMRRGEAPASGGRSTRGGAPHSLPLPECPSHQQKGDIPTSNNTLWNAIALAEFGERWCA